MRSSRWWLAVAATLAGCLPGTTPGTLAPTLVLADADGSLVAWQNGTPVPDFGWQPRPRLELDGPWRTEPATFDAALTMADRSASLPAIEEEAGGRQDPGFDDDAWATIDVPGTTNPPPDGREGGAWYRRTFDAPASWRGAAVRLAFGSVNYVADVWLNGTWLGYHEGGRTPFAFDVGSHLLPGDANTILVRVHTIPPGTRSDVLPWGLIDWWNYGGITGPVWLEASPPTHVVRADVTPHLDALDFRVLLHRPPVPVGGEVSEDEDAPQDDAGDDDLILRASVLPAVVTDANLVDPDPRALLADDATPIVSVDTEVPSLGAGAVHVASLSIAFGDADFWSPESPSLYVLRVRLERRAEPTDPREAFGRDAFWTTFGVRDVVVDPEAPRVLLNGEPVMFSGVGLHGESLRFGPDGELVDGSPWQGPEEVVRELEEARLVGADFVRTGHEPADPLVLLAADRLGFAVWEEIPLYHATPAIFERSMERGVPQQMLREMALRDMNRPSVLFHGLANESTGDEGRTAALTELLEVDREIDGTRLVGQAAYGWDPSDPTQSVLDVAGFTSYQGVFYGNDPGADTHRFLRAAHEANPTLPIMVLEYGRWADTPSDERIQRRIYEETEAAIRTYRADREGGFVSASSWWTLRDFATRLSGVVVEDFGLVRSDGSLRPAGEVAVERAGSPEIGGAPILPEPDLVRARPQTSVADGWRLLAWLGYGLGLVIGGLGLVLVVLVRRGGRAVASR